MRILITAVFLMVGCATSKYAYSGVATKPECEAICASYGYPLIGLSSDGGCVCNTLACQRPKHLGGCEKLPSMPNATAPSTQM